MTAAVPAGGLIRGPQLEILVPRSRGVPFDEALRIAEQGRYVIASNARMSKALVGSKPWDKPREYISEVLCCWTGTMTAYAKPGEKLGATIEYTDPKTEQRWVFPVPKQFVGMKDVILVAEHPDYTLEREGKNRVVQAGIVDVVENFPMRNERAYLADAKHGIPQGDAVSGIERNARFLWRTDSTVSPAARGDHIRGDDYIMRCVRLNVRPSIGFGVAVEAPEPKAPQPAEAKAKQGDKI